MTHRNQPFRNPSRHGLGSLEALAALGVLATVLSLAPPLLVQNQRLLGEQRLHRLSVEALTNRLEELVGLPVESLSGAMTPTPVDGIPDAVIRGEFTPEDPGYRITLKLERPGLGRRPHEVGLVGWSFATPARVGAGEGTP